ncbi:MAG: N-6 DNA methylase [Dehalococcoides mccartyi]|jgi:Type I restriction-modification system methyltransferase subunit|uniref:Eco57I restriction-modification methylase domain-containing protein n=1 Tax=Dehalococcoides TaxID=61434 RepID=UPI00098EE7B2|nr:N-6 DNA methylase [Dehalococcoides mccartyi]AQU02709.1 hypothetical protein B1773_01210 [Dehalococcoides mccartyi]AQU04044.1 hypothetical protein B1774_01070 [Dehalococcoides mccartyi]MDP4279504.1 N-6 DNA methylase [Dehalococcoides mccartyi]
MIDKETATRIIRNTFEKTFDKTQFTNFSKNLVNYLDTSGNFSYQGNYIPDAYKPYIQTLERIGQYQDIDSKTIEVLIVQLKKETSLERARTMQRNFIAWYLDGSRGGEFKDAALVAVISPDSEDWRFSLVKMEYNLGLSEKTGRLKTEKLLTPARRYSFLVGSNESSHTAQIQLLPILRDDKNNPTLTDLENAFSIEVVTKEFFEKYRELFHKVEESLQKVVNKDKKIKDDFDAKDVNTVNFSKKLLGQIVFLYFLQKKGWLGVPENERWGNGDRRFLRSLFTDCQKNKSSYFNDYLEHLFYDALNNQNRGGIDPSYYPRFGCRIPFLNGGLFDPINNYDWINTDICLPNELFSNNEKTKEGDTGTGILDIFDRYNFTVKEDEPLDKEVAVDPEMLGKVFENLLEVKDRKSKGTYYTPREIVHYMCQESLINYLNAALNTGDVALVSEKPTNLKLFGAPAFQQQALKTLGSTNNVPREDIEVFIHSGDLVAENDAHVENNEKETKRYSYKLPASIREHAALIDDKLANVRVCDPAVGSGAFPVGLMTEIVRARNTLTTYLPEKTERSYYNFKRHAIQNCLYGVDIDSGATEIAKLRLWLSLVVDEEDIKQIRPLPNLDYKIVCGNSLLGVERNMFNNELFKKLEELKPLYFNETNAKKKQTYKNDIDSLISEITHDKKKFDFEVYFSEIFHEKGGFDIVIANPPYLVLSADYPDIEYFNTAYHVSKGGKKNLYKLFFERALNLLRDQGSLSFITPNNYLTSADSIALRRFLLKQALIQEIIEYSEADKVFEAVTQAVCTIVLVKSISNNELMLYSKNGEQSVIDQNQVLNDPRLLIKGRSNVIEKIKQNKHRLSDYIIGFQGEVNVSTKKKHFVNVKKSPNYLPLVRGNQVKHYSIADYTQEYCPKNVTSRNHYEIERVVFQEVANAALDRRLNAVLLENVLCGHTTNYLISSSNKVTNKFLLALTNSKLFNYYFKYYNQTNHVPIGEIKSIPTPSLDQIEQNIFTNLVDQILFITKDKDYLADPSKQAKVKELENQIDQMVYKLYELSSEEIAVVEGVGK